ATLTVGTANGGTNWPGGSYDPETYTVYVGASNATVVPIGLIPPPSKNDSDMNYVLGTAGQPFRISRGPGELAGADALLQAAEAERTRAAAQPAPAPAAPAAAVAGGGSNVQGLKLLKPPYGTIAAPNL